MHAPRKARVSAAYQHVLLSRDRINTKYTKTYCYHCTAASACSLLHLATAFLCLLFFVVRFNPACLFLASCRQALPLNFVNINLQPPPPRHLQGELLSQWELMRTELFGTGGATVSGLFSAGPAGQRHLSPPSPPNTPFSSTKTENMGDGSTAVRNSGQSLLEAMNRRGFSGKDGDKAEAGGFGSERGGGRAVLRSPVLGCVAESLAPARSTHEMSNFMAKMRG